METSSTASTGVLTMTSKAGDLILATALGDLQLEEQGRVLDTIAHVRKCGLDSVLSLPQLVVCGDQSAGKSSVLEALTEIPFPRSDNLCTRFATEIILRRGPINNLTVKVISDSNRPGSKQDAIRNFAQTITDFGDLPRVMDLAMSAMGITKDSQNLSGSAFAKDILSIEIEGPSRPQLTLVDIPGLIQTATKGVTDADVELVAGITDRYISQPRTICLAVVSATNDAANQPILTKVRQVDLQGERTLGIITKPDRLPAGSGTEGKFLELARNEDVFFKLGWHVLKNRSFEMGDCTLEERNIAESLYFSKSRFSSLPAENLGIDTLRTRLSRLLFDHVKQELPKLRQDLEDALEDSRKELAKLGDSRTSTQECKAYLSQLSLEYWKLCNAAVGGRYEDGYFQSDFNEPFSVTSKETIVRLRAVIQYLNTNFESDIRKKGHKYALGKELQDPDGEGSDDSDDGENKAEEQLSEGHESVYDGSDYDGKESTVADKPEYWKLKEDKPIALSKADLTHWELVGNSNPLLIGALFWEQSARWKNLASTHIEDVCRICDRFVDILLEEKAPKDVKSRLWSTKIIDSLKARRQAAIDELDKLIEDLKSFPINYNHYYTYTIHKRRQARQKAGIEEAVNAAITSKQEICNRHCLTQKVDVASIISKVSKGPDPNMESFSCEEALDCLFAIYKVQQKTFVANVTTQVIERHIVRGLESIFSPTVVNAMVDSEVKAIASEPDAAKRKRMFLTDRIKKLEDGQEIFRNVLGGGSRHW